MSRASLASAGALGLVGALRLASDGLTDIDPAWADPLGGHWLRHAVRAPSDGSVAGDLNVRFFKVLAVPCGLGVAWFLNLLAAGSLAEADRRWASPAARWGAPLALFAVCTFIELEKAGRGLGIGLAPLLPGEIAAWNHAAHAASLVLGVLVARRLRYRAR